MTIIVNIDKLKGSVKTSAKGTKYLDGGSMVIGKSNVRVSWLRPDEAQINKGGLVFANLEVNKRDDKTYPQITISHMVPVVTPDNSTWVEGEVVEIKEFNKLISATVRYEHTNWSKETNAATVSFKSFDKESAVGKALKAAKGNGKHLFIGKLDPSSNGYIEFTAMSVMPLGGSASDVELTTAADVPSAAVEEETPF